MQKRIRCISIDKTLWDEAQKKYPRQLSKLIEDFLAEVVNKTPEQKSEPKACANCGTTTRQLLLMENATGEKKLFCLECTRLITGWKMGA